MREILFRGFHPNEDGEDKIYSEKYKQELQGEWVYGFIAPVYIRDKETILHIITEDIGQYNAMGMSVSGTPKSFEVLKETISQFTGLFDKNGNKIFENDLIEFENGATYEIVYEDHMLKISNETDKYALFEIEDDEFIIIGNIFQKEQL